MDDSINKGWVCLHRKLLESPVWTNHNVARFWLWCLMKATHTQHIQTVGYQEVALEPGQFVFGRKVAAEQTGLTQQNIRTCLGFLTKHGNLTIKSTNRFSLITIVNWASYQTPPDPNNQQSNQQSTSKQPAANQQVTTDNKGNKADKGNNGNKDKPPSARELAADRIVKAYIALVARPDDSNTKQARKNVEKLLKATHPESLLLECAENYANSSACSSDKDYRFKASNFYGRSGEWESHTDKPASSNTIGSKHVDAYGEPLEATA
jgi:hypothetical protein